MPPNAMVSFLQLAAEKKTNIRPFVFCQGFSSTHLMNYENANYLKVECQWVYIVLGITNILE